MLAACTGGEVTAPSDPAGSHDRLSVYVVSYPLQYFAERIGGDRVNVSFPAREGEDPAYWRPAPEIVAGYQSADLILLSGAGYAGWIAHASLPRRSVVDTSTAFQDRIITVDDAVAHIHGPGGEHAHAGEAFTVWLDPTLALAQATAVADALASRLPAYRGEIDTRLNALAADLHELDRRLTSIAKRIGDRALLFSHPVYQYLVARYELRGESLHWEPDEEPSEQMWKDLDELLAGHHAQWMLWEAEPLVSTREQLEARGVQVVVFEPCGNRPSHGDFMTVMQRNARALLDAVGQQP